MRLHTDFRDYYDQAVGYGIDDNVHYNRFIKETEIDFKTQRDFPDHISASILGFCGTIYPFIELKKYEREYDESGSVNYKVIKRSCAYTLEEYKRQELEWEDGISRPTYQDHSRETKLRQFFIDWKYQSDDIFRKYKVPIWTLSLNRYERKGILNPRLKDYGFDRIVDPLTAFQEISMYLSNVLVEQKETVVIKDKFKIEKHGFDLKTSFRKEKKS